jgi:ABC-type transport system involved in cytochrome bd biosynthesis fused ATPase/permease subunit
MLSVGSVVNLFRPRFAGRFTHSHPDEATQHTHTERIIQTALAKLPKGRIAFVIAHRLSQWSRDLIVVSRTGVS